MSETDSYYVRRRGRVEGPWPMSKLRSEVGLRKLGRHDEVSVDGEVWLRAGELDGLMEKTTAYKVVDPLAGRTDDTPHPVHQDAVGTVRADFEDGEPIWYYCSDGESQVGPITLGELQGAVTNGNCPLDAMVYRDGFDDWRPLEDVPEILSAIERDFARGGDTAATRLIQRTAPAAKSQKPLFALGFGVGSLLLSWIPLVGFAGIVGIVIGGMAIRENSGQENTDSAKTMSVVGIVTGVISVFFSLVVLIVFIYAVRSS